MQGAANSDIGLASVQKGIEGNATTKGAIDVQGGLRTTRKGSSLLQGTRNEDLSFLGLPGHSSLSTLDKFCGILVPKRGLVGEQQLQQWCKLLADHGVKVEWSQEKPESAYGIGGATQPIGSSASLSWSRMFHHSCQWSMKDTLGQPGFGRQRRQSDLPSMR